MIVIDAISPQLLALVRVILDDPTVTVIKKDATTSNGRALVCTPA